MKLIDIANGIDKSEKNEDWIDTSEIGDELGVDIPYVDQKSLKCYWVGNWNCTDTFVGYRMYFLDSEPIAFTTQSGRKSNEKFQWFSKELAIKTRDYLLSLIIESNDGIHVDICDINEDIGDSFKINYCSEIIYSNRVKLNNEKVEILERVKNEPYGIDTELKIKLTNGDEKHVNIRDLDFGYHVK